MISKVWNKEDQINGVEAVEVLNSIPGLLHDEVILICDEYSGRVMFIEQYGQLKGILKIAEDIEPIELGNRYIEFLEAQSQPSQEDLQTQERIAKLEEDNAQMTYALMMGGLL